MTKLDDFFGGTADTLEHPRVRNWHARLKTGQTAVVEVFRPESDFGFTQSELHVQFTDGDKLLPLESMPWDDELNAGLIRLTVKAANPEEEAKRFSLGLRAALRKPATEFGDGYFNSVFVEYLQKSELGNRPPIADLLPHAFSARPANEGKSQRGYDLCRDMITSAISGRAHELTAKLRYERPEAESILVDAIARYIDDRFSISRRKRMGWL